MGLCLVTGGVRSGKSAFAESLCRERVEHVVYLATGKATDEEMKERIALHRQRRPAHWQVTEEALDVAAAIDSIPDTHGILFDSVTAWVSNWLEQWERERGNQNGHERCLKALEEEAENWLAMLQGREVVVVTDEVGLGGIAMHPVSRLFQDALGLVNQKVAERADEVWFVVSGVPWMVKG